MDLAAGIEPWVGPMKKHERREKKPAFFLLEKKVEKDRQPRQR